MAGSWSGNVYNGDDDDEMVIGRKSSDSIYGMAGADTLFGGAGDDRVDGGEGDDSLAGDAGDDLIYGDVGSDTVSGGDGDDTIQVDTFNSTDDDVAEGGEGDDSIQGGGGADRLDGGAGDDVITNFSLDLGVDTLIGGAGVDQYYGASSKQVVMSGDMQKGGAISIDGQTAIELSGFEEIRFYAQGQSSDVLIGGSGDDDMLAGHGSDTVRTGAGNDRFSLVLDGVTDKIDLGAGDGDLIRIEQAFGATPLIVDVKGGLSFKLGDFKAQTVTGAEKLFIRGGAGDDSLVGLDAGDLLYAGLGANTVSGGAGDDSLGGELDAMLDKYDGGKGVDNVSFSSAAAAISVDVRGKTSLAVKVDGKVVATVKNVENFYFGGSAFDDDLVGLAGDDGMFGGTGDDTLDGGDGDDLLTGGSGVDRLIGGKGVDTASYGAEDQSVVITLKNGAATATVGGVKSDKLSGIENLGGGTGDDRFKGDDNDNIFHGGRGQDTFDGGKGDDIVSFRDSGRAVDVTLRGSTEVTVKTGFFPTSDDSVTFRNFEGVIGSSQADTIKGDAGANVLIGGAGADTLTGGAGKDVFGFTGFDQSTTDAPDRIMDFSGAKGDRLDFSDLRADPFANAPLELNYIGAGRFSGEAGEIRFEKGKMSSLLIDLDGDKIADFQVDFANGAKISEGDLIL